MEKKASAEKAVREIRRKTRRRFSAEEKIRIPFLATCQWNFAWNSYPRSVRIV